MNRAIAIFHGSIIICFCCNTYYCISYKQLHLGPTLLHKRNEASVFIIIEPQGILLGIYVQQTLKSTISI